MFTITILCHPAWSKLTFDLKCCFNIKNLKIDNLSSNNIKIILVNCGDLLPDVLDDIKDPLDVFTVLLHSQPFSILGLLNLKQSKVGLGFQY